MRRSVRNQILVPLIAIQGLAVAAIALAAAALAAGRSERQVVDRLHDVIGTLGHGNFPYTAWALAQMRGLSGAHFVACDARGRVIATSFATPDEMPRSLDSVAPAAHIDSLGASPVVRVDGARYYAARLQSPTREPGSSLVVLYPEASWRQTRREAALPPLMLGFGSLVLTAAVAGWIAQRIGVRIRRVERQVALIAEGDFRELELGRERDEVYDLSCSINRMCVQLREMSRTIRQSERTRLLGKLAAGLAHQLRNSLTGARMSVQLHARRFPAPEGDRSLEVALRQLAMTEEHVRGLLSLGRVEQRPASLVEAGHLVEDVALLVRPSCEHAKVALEVRQDGAPVVLRGDEPGLRAALLNLALNAIEAAGPGGRVGLAVRSEAHSLVIEVSDNGLGPPPELAENLFEAFVSSKPEGAGLGLALAQQVAVAHGGSLSWARQAGETRFRFVVPRLAEVLEDAV